MGAGGQALQGSPALGQTQLRITVLPLVPFTASQCLSPQAPTVLLRGPRTSSAQAPRVTCSSSARSWGPCAHTSTRAAAPDSSCAVSPRQHPTLLVPGVQAPLPHLEPRQPGTCVGTGAWLWAIVVGGWSLPFRGDEGPPRGRGGWARRSRLWGSPSTCSQEMRVCQAACGRGVPRVWRA